MNDILSFCEPESGEMIDFHVIEETRVNNTNYLLVSPACDDDEETEAYILKDVSKPEDEEAVYEIVEDDRELEAVAGIFQELLEDFDIE